MQAKTVPVSPIKGSANSAGGGKALIHLPLGKRGRESLEKTRFQIPGNDNEEFERVFPQLLDFKIFFRKTAPNRLI